MILSGFDIIVLMIMTFIAPIHQTLLLSLCIKGQTLVLLFGPSSKPKVSLQDKTNPLSYHFRSGSLPAASVIDTGLHFVSYREAVTSSR